MFCQRHDKKGDIALLAPFEYQHPASFGSEHRPFKEAYERQEAKRRCLAWVTLSHTQDSNPTARHNVSEPDHQLVPQQTGHGTLPHFRLRYRTNGSNHAQRARLNFGRMFAAHRDACRTIVCCTGRSLKEYGVECNFIGISTPQLISSRQSALASQTYSNFLFALLFCSYLQSIN